MQSQLRGVALPACLLALLAAVPYPTYSESLPWPYNLPSHVKYHPEEADLIKREEAVIHKMSQHQPVVGMKKMSDDEGEKFYLDYWVFAPTERDGTAFEQAGRQRNSDEHSSAFPNNMTERFALPFTLHSSGNTTLTQSRLWQRNLHFPLLPRSRLDKRDFQCPTGTSSCASIDRVNSCCAEGQTCQLIQDTGLGDVGCCASGETCAGSLSECASGQISCPNYSAGGCCVSGYACVTGGCLLTSTATVVINPSPSSTRSPPSTSASLSTSSSSISTSSVSSVIRAPSTSTSDMLESTISTITSTSISCSSGFRSCPASLGGGCCPTDRACGRDLCPELSSTATISAPVRPTSNSPATTTDPSITGCPTGFYACSAFYQGGCCRDGRDCAPTSCPSGPMTSLIDDNGVTIVAPTASGLSANSVPTGDCAAGWSTCGASQGGGCCPSGYICGSSCTVSATESGLEASPVAKVAPNAADRGKGRHGEARVLLGIVACLTALLL